MTARVFTEESPGLHKPVGDHLWSILAPREIKTPHDVCRSETADKLLCVYLAINRRLGCFKITSRRLGNFQRPLSGEERELDSLERERGKRKIVAVIEEDHRKNQVTLVAVKQEPTDSGLG